MQKRITKVFFLLIFVLSPVTAEIWNKYFVIYSNNWRFSNVSRHEQNVQKMKCLAICSHTTGCETVNHNSVSKSCELLNPGPWIPTAESQTESNWAVYYKGDRHVTAIEVWQTSTYIYIAGGNSTHPADLAVDGIRKNIDWKYCAHTSDRQSTWAMEFEHVVEISHVVIYFMNSQTYNYRHTNLRFLISNTRQDSDNNIGNDCATYMGPPASPLPPVKVSCTKPVTGKFLTIIFNLPHFLVLCEVEVYTT